MEETLPHSKVRIGTPAGADGKQFRSNAVRSRLIFFDRQELQLILNTYSRKVMAGEWLDYGIRRERDAVVFSVYGRASSFALFDLRKQTETSKRERYALSQRGRILKMDSSLTPLLRLMGRRRLKLID